MALLSTYCAYAQTKIFPDISPSNGITAYGTLSGTETSSGSVLSGIASSSFAGSGESINASLSATSKSFLGIGYVGEAWIQYKFNTSLPAGTKVYIPFDLPTSSGVSLDLLDLVGGLVGLINDNIVNVSVYSGATSASNGSEITTNLAKDIVRDEEGRLYFQVTSLGESFNSVRFRLRYKSSFLSLNFGANISTKTYAAFFYSATDYCTPALTTDLGRSSGININLSETVFNPEYAIDDNSSNYSEVQLGALAVGATASQTIYFPELSEENSTLSLRMQLNSAAVNVNVLGAIQIKAYNGNTQVFTQTVNGGPIGGLDVLGLLEGGGIVTVPFAVALPYDRVEIIMNSTLNLSVGSGIRIYSLTRSSDSCEEAEPTVSPLNQPICVNSELVSLSNVDDANYATDSDFDSFATIRSDAGILFGLGSREGHLELEFGQMVPVGKTALVRIEYDRDVLDALLGGSLGELLSGLVEGLVLGDHYFEVTLKNGSTQLLTTSSEDSFGSSDGQVKLVQDMLGRYYLAINADSEFDRIRLTDHTASALGILSSDKYLQVFNVCFDNGEDFCRETPDYTSYTASGVTLDLLELNPIIVNPEDAIDNNPNSASEISAGVVGLFASAEQIVHFSNPVEAGNDLLVSLAIEDEDLSVLELSLFDNIQFKLYSGSELIDTRVAGDLIDLNLLSLLSSGEYYDFIIRLDVPITGLGVEILNGINASVSANAKVNFSGIKTQPSPPTVQDPSENGAYQICEGESLTISPVLESGMEYDWYTDSLATDFIGTADAYEITADQEPGTYDFYLIARRGGCSQKSIVSHLNVLVTEKVRAERYRIQPGGDVIVEQDEDGNEIYTYVQGHMSHVTLLPDLNEEYAGVSGSFRWFFDEGLSEEIVTGMIDEDGVSYEVDSENSGLIMSGMEYSTEVDAYVYYLSWESETEGVCSAQEAKRIDLRSIARILNLNFVDFSAKGSAEGEVTLQWKLRGSETDAGEIFIERAGPDLNFVTVGSVEFGIDYLSVIMLFKDENPMVGSNYYRLKWIKNEVGSAPVFSEVRLVKIDFIKEKIFKVFPNAFTDQISIQSPMNIANGVVQLHDLNGNLIKSSAFHNLNSGENLDLMDLARLPHGNYVLRLRFKNQIISFNVLK